jgi:DNA-binding MarR family transcriptional regulator
MELRDYFIKDLPPRQRQYEAIRAVAFNEGTIKDIAERFRYTPQTLRMLINRLVRDKFQLFPDIKRGPKGRRIPSETERMLIQLRRKKMLNSREITEELNRLNISIGVRTVERILGDAGFPKLRRRTDKERGISKQGTIIPERSMNLSLKKLQPFRSDCQVAGIFLFLPYILNTGILDIVQGCALPESGDIGKQQAALSMLLLKLIGNERLSHIKQYNTDTGFGVFAGLKVLPKPTYMCSYSCRTEASVVMKFQQRIMNHFNKLYPDLYQGKTINLDFHSIPHFGDESGMEKVWCGTRGKSLKGANTFFAQDGESDALIYTNADIKRAESSEEIKKFIDYWGGIKGIVKETLVFDSKLTRYDILYEMDTDDIKFITLRTRSKSLIEQTMKIPEKDWQKVYLPIPKRKYKHVKVHESTVVLIEGQKAFRQVIVKDHGRAEPTFIISNNEKLKIADLLTIYAKRWHIENKLSDLVKFFNLNALSSPIMIRIHFDLLWTIIADTLYLLLAKDLRRFENCSPQKLFKQFIDMPGQIDYDGSIFTVRIRKRATTPILLGIEKLNKEIIVPWLDHKPLRIIWTP